MLTVVYLNDISHNCTMEFTIVQKIAILVLPLIFGITLHEVAHGWVAWWCGDPTAKLSGRLSLNPIHHIDPVGTIIVPILMFVTTGFIFGWAKPVPVDARNMKNPRRDMALVAIAGPISNILMAFFWGGIALIGIHFGELGNGWLGVPLTYMGEIGIMINVVLGVLNLIPLPPLDGGRFLVSILPPRMGYQLSLIEPYSFFILILLLVSGVLSLILSPLIQLTMQLIGGVIGL
ncbi:MAG TPA: site-2 protease family protein [Gammaproteobacteria bacterium]|jgi:Zn-dependent protease|nr:site-2 protease family protein [Gammaproteobacteria bacterium]